MKTAGRKVSTAFSEAHARIAPDAGAGMSEGEAGTGPLVIQITQKSRAYLKRFSSQGESGCSGDFYIFTPLFQPPHLMSKRKLFIVEDDPMFAEMLIDFMKSRPQWAVSYFPSGEDCVKEAYQDPEVVIIDYHLDNLQSGGMNGIDTMLKIKKIVPNAHCIFLSGQQKYGVALQTISLGAENYVFKDESAFSEIGKILDSIRVD